MLKWPGPACPRGDSGTKTARRTDAPRARVRRPSSRPRPVRELRPGTPGRAGSVRLAGGGGDLRPSPPRGPPAGWAPPTARSHGARRPRRGQPVSPDPSWPQSPRRVRSAGTLKAAIVPAARSSRLCRPQQPAGGTAGLRTALRSRTPAPRAARPAPQPGPVAIRPAPHPGFRAARSCPTRSRGTGGRSSA